MSRGININIKDEDLAIKLVMLSKKDHRSYTAQVEKILEQHFEAMELAGQLFIDDKFSPSPANPGQKMQKYEPESETD